jgi:hypothetical protein
MLITKLKVDPPAKLRFAEACKSTIGRDAV